MFVQIMVITQDELQWKLKILMIITQKRTDDYRSKCKMFPWVSLVDLFFLWHNKWAMLDTDQNVCEQKIGRKIWF